MSRTTAATIPCHELQQPRYHVTNYSSHDTMSRTTAATIPCPLQGVLHIFYVNTHTMEIQRCIRTKHTREPTIYTYSIPIIYNTSALLIHLCAINDPLFVPCMIHTPNRTAAATIPCPLDERQTHTRLPMGRSHDTMPIARRVCVAFICINRLVRKGMSHMGIKGTCHMGWLRYVGSLKL